MVRISLLAHTFRGENQKKRKVFGAKLLVQSWRAVVFFVMERNSKFCGAQIVFLGAQAPKCTPVAPGLLLSFGAQSLLRGHNSRLGGTNSDLGGGHNPEMPPVAQGLS